MKEEFDEEVAENLLHVVIALLGRVNKRRNGRGYTPDWFGQCDLFGNSSALVDRTTGMYASVSVKVEQVDQRLPLPLDNLHLCLNTMRRS